MATSGTPDPDRHGDDQIDDTTSVTASASASANSSTDYAYQTSGLNIDLQTSEPQDRLSITTPDLQISEPQDRPSITTLALSQTSDEWKLKIFLMKLAKEITDEELNEMKFVMQGECGMGKRALSEIKSVKEFFSYMMEVDFVDKYNLLQLQSVLWHLGRKDLHAQFVTFARDYNTSPLHFFVPQKKPRNGYTHVDFHIGGDLATTSKQDLEILRGNIAERLCVPPKFIFIKGIEPLHSLIVTLMVPEAAVFALFELSEIEKSTLQNLKIDSFGVGDKRVELGDLKFEKAAVLSEKEEIQRILEKKEKLTSELDKSQARLIQHSKALSSSQEELAKVKVTSDQLKVANDRAMMILATLVYQDLALHSRPVDSLCRLSISAYFKYCLEQFRSRFPEAGKHIGDLLDANALVVRKTERDMHKNYVERLQIHQLALEYRCQTVQPTYTLSDLLFQRPSQSVQQQFRSTSSQPQVYKPPTLTTEQQEKTAPPKKKLFERRSERKSAQHPFHSALKEISLKLQDAHKTKLMGNIRFNKFDEIDLSKHPEKFLQILFETEMGKIPADPCEHVLKKLRIIGDSDLHKSADKLLTKRKKDLKFETDTSSQSGHKKKTSDILNTSFYKSLQRLSVDLSFDPHKTPQRTQESEPKGGKSEHPESHGVHRSVSESALRRHDWDEGIQEKLDQLLGEVESLKLMVQNQSVYRSSPVSAMVLGPKTPPTSDFLISGSPDY
ncbi:uncharacterized protein [Argopecten irradians]|uniref:uncharacterized protein isoform X2 n=1 Tax=Argopecten irradians TaxID=31199 RepID=UPI0037175B30